MAVFPEQGIGNDPPGTNYDPANPPSFGLAPPAPAAPAAPTGSVGGTVSGSGANTTATFAPAGYTSSLFTPPPYTPPAGQDDPRNADPNYWTNLAKLQFENQTAYAAGQQAQQFSDINWAATREQMQTGQQFANTNYAALREQQTAGRIAAGQDYHAALAQAKTAQQFANVNFGAARGGLQSEKDFREQFYGRERNQDKSLRSRAERDLAESMISRGLSYSGYHERSQSEREQDWKFQRGMKDLTQQQYRNTWQGRMDNLIRGKEQDDVWRRYGVTDMQREKMQADIQRRFMVSDTQRAKMQADYARSAELGNATRQKMQDDAARQAAQQALLQGFGIDAAGLLANATATYVAGQLDAARNDTGAGSVAPEPTAAAGSSSDAIAKAKAILANKSGKTQAQINWAQGILAAR